MSAKLQRVHIRVNDAATGKPTPCRVHFSDGPGNYYAPNGRTSKFPRNFPPWGLDSPGTSYDHLRSAYIDGTCEIVLPPGVLRVVIEKGPEFSGLNQEVYLPEGKLSLRFALNRVIDPAAERWYAGTIIRSSHSPHEILLAGAAEGLRVVDLLAHERERTRDGRTRTVISHDLQPPAISEPSVPENAVPRDTLIDYPNIIAFSGDRPCLETPECLVAVNTLNRHRALGCLALLHCHRPVYPLRFGRAIFDDSAYHKPDNWTLSDWCDQCHRKRGLVVGLDVQWRHDDTDPWFGGEELANLILGKVDAIVGHGDDACWYGLLGIGVPVPIVWHGHYSRTYVHLEAGEAFNYTNWIEAIRNGRTAVSHGPFLTFTINGQAPGAHIDLTEQNANVTIRAEARAREFFRKVEVVHNGKAVLMQMTDEQGLFTATIEQEYQIGQGGWLAARCTGGKNTAGEPTDWTEAHTSPIYVRLNEQPPPVDAGVVHEIDGCFDRMLTWVEHQAHCETAKDRARLANVFLDAKQVLLRKLEH